MSNPGESRKHEYDVTNPDSIIEYAKRLVDFTLRRKCSAETVYGTYKGKGKFGQFLEKSYFGIDVNNRPEPDFPEAGLELKSFPLAISKKGKIRAKERMVLSIIDFCKIVDEEFESSSFWTKNRRLLVVFYLYAAGTHSLDQLIKDVDDIDMVSPDFKKDLKIIKNDWLHIKNKVSLGLAHEISESDTLYLGACTKGSSAAKSFRDQPNSSEKAKQRAFSLKQSYMNAYVIKEGIATKGRTKKYESLQTNLYEIGDEFDLRSFVVRAFENYYGHSTESLRSVLGITCSHKAKQFYAQITRRILGVGLNSNIEEFIKAGITVRTIRTGKNGKPKEAISFPYFKYCTIAEQSWEQSDLRKTLCNPFLFIVFQDTGKDLVLSTAFFWSMPNIDLQLVERTWLKTRGLILDNNAENLPRSSETKVIHVRPHAKNKEDTNPLPNGKEFVKKCFWLNRSYIIDEVLSP